jgi:predicted acetyltransferase
MPYLIAPTGADPALRASYLQAMQEYEDHDGYRDSGLSITDLQTGDCLENHTRTLREGTSMRPGVTPLRPCEWWWVEATATGTAYLGRAALRHHPEPGTGHLHVTIRPSRRRQGHGRALLTAALPIARSHGINPILLACPAADIAARHMIEACGATLKEQAGDRSTYSLEQPR